MAMASRSDTELLPLAGGRFIKAIVFDWLLDASWRLSFSVTGEGKLHVHPQAAVMREDVEFIRQYRDELVEAIRYVTEHS